MRQVPRDLFDRLALEKMLTPNPPNRLHRQHSPPPASNQSKQRIRPIRRGSILDADPPARHRYHESLSNLTPADVYSGRGQTILLQRERIKRQTIQNRRLLHQNKAA